MLRKTARRLHPKFHNVLHGLRISSLAFPVPKFRAYFPLLTQPIDDGANCTHWCQHRFAHLSKYLHCNEHAKNPTLETRTRAPKSCGSLLLPAQALRKSPRFASFPQCTLRSEDESRTFCELLLTYPRGCYRDWGPLWCRPLEYWYSPISFPDVPWDLSNYFLSPICTAFRSSPSEMKWEVFHFCTIWHIIHLFSVDRIRCYV